LVVPTLTFKLLFVLVVLSHDRRKGVHFGITANPTAEWTAQQITEAFPRDEAPKLLIRDRHRAYGRAFRNRVTAMGILDVQTAPRSPWQNGYVERIIGSLSRILKCYFAYYNQSRTHLALNKDAPIPRPTASASGDQVVAIPEVGGLHHRYERLAASRSTPRCIPGLTGAVQASEQVGVALIPAAFDPLVRRKTKHEPHSSAEIR
jgi:hypothetical protein